MGDNVIHSEIQHGSIALPKLEDYAAMKYVKDFISQKFCDEQDTGIPYVNIEKSRKKEIKKLRKPRNPRKKMILSNSDKKEMKLFDIPPEQHRYTLYEPLHELWLGYMRDCLSLPPFGKQAVGTKLLKCDLHGSYLRVTKSSCPSYVGVCGILLQETRNTFKIITENDKLKTIPKVNCEFTYGIDDMVVTIHGKHFRVKSSDRALKGRMKDKITIDL